MPNYDLHCLECGSTYSKSLSISERKEARCNKCGGNKLEQVYKRCNLMGGKGSTGGSFPGGQSSCSHTGGCAGCTGC